MKNFYRPFWLRSASYFLLSFFVISTSGIKATTQSDSVRLYTPYIRISVPPGQSIDYSVDVINNSKEIKNVDISVTGVPRSWNYELKSGTWDVKEISILPGEKKSVNLKLDVPLNVNKGSYRFRITAGG